MHMLRRLPLAFALSVFALGCSDPVPDPAEGAMILTLDSPIDTPGASCPIVGAQTNIGNPPPTLSSPGGKVKEGVKCAVRGGGTFNFSGEIPLGNVYFFASGSVTEGGTGSATVSAQGHITGESFKTVGGRLCTVGVDQGSLQVGPGRIFARVSCDSLQGSMSSRACGATGVFVFERCDD
jgi:hypothetical protein